MRLLFAHHPGALGPINHLGVKTALSVAGAALLDGMNPTALGVLLLILWQGVGTKSGSRKAALYFIAGLVTTYLAAGVLLRQVYLDFGPNLFVQAIQALLAMLLFLSGLSEVIAAIRPSGKRLVEVPAAIKGRMEKATDWLNKGLAYPVGLLVGVVELFATGAIYLSFVQAITYDPTAPAWVLGAMILIYLAVFCLPMAAVVLYEPLVELLLGSKDVSVGARAVRGLVGALFMAAAIFIAASAYVTVASTHGFWWF